MVGTRNLIEFYIQTSPDGSKVGRSSSSQRNKESKGIAVYRKKMERKVRIINHMMCIKGKKQEERPKIAKEVLVEIFTAKDKS